MMDWSDETVLQIPKKNLMAWLNITILKKQKTVIISPFIS